ncbi:hypothetical protein TNCV_247661 [Trichonephila clavipes]|nr:hypothetical protein TNCV_247661 [Trichonephila clavipes]
MPFRSLFNSSLFAVHFGGRGSKVGIKLDADTLRFTCFVPSQPHSGLFHSKVVLHVPVLSRGYILEKTLLNKSVMPMRKRGSLDRKAVKSKAVEHTRAAEAPDEKRARLQTDQVRHSLARAAETPEQRQ